MKSLFLLLLLMFQTPSAPSGVWDGTVSLPGQELALSITLTRTADAWTGTFDIPAQGAKRVAMSGLAVSGASVSFSIPGAGPPSFKMTIAPDGKSMSGALTQGGGSFPVKLAQSNGAKPAAPEIVDGGKLEGIWQGSLPVGGQQIRLVFRVTKAASGSISATFSSPDQGPGEFPVAGLGFRNSVLQFSIPAMGGSYQGTLGADGTTITGTFIQGISVPLVFRKTDKVGDLNRPQEPKKPYPYEEVEVTYPNARAGITLAGTLTQPKGQAPFPVVLLITGSGPQDRDEGIAGHRPFLVLSDHLTRKGIAVLRVDDRGVGKSTGDFAGATTKDFASDVIAGVQFLKGRKEIDAKHIGLIGQSEGGLIAPMVASQTGGVAFIVLLAGPGLPGDDILYAQAALSAKSLGASDAQLAAQRAAQQKVYAVVKSNLDVQTMRQNLLALGDTEPDAALSPWFRFFLSYDPRPALMKTKCPVLAINGEKDVQVPARENIPAIEAALKSGGNKDYKTVVLPNLNHLFQTSQTGLPAEYGTIEETMSPIALNLVSDWIVQHTAHR